MELVEKYLYCLWVIGSLIVAICYGTKCFKAQSLGEAEGNVYYCSDNQKPECCQQNSQFTCCESDVTKTWKEQTQLWAVVAAVGIMIGLVFVCCRQDHTICSGDDRSLAQRFRLRKHPDPKLTDLNQAGKKDIPAKPKNGNSRSGGGLPPLPHPAWHPEGQQYGGRHGTHAPLFHDGCSGPQRGKYSAGYNQDGDDYRY